MSSPDFARAITNDMLRRTVGGQASESRHILGKAADVHFPDVPLKNLRYSALIRERGGVGYYPTSALPFVHVDTDRVRAWPRLPRYELALLFPRAGRSICRRKAVPSRAKTCASPAASTRSSRPRLPNTATGAISPSSPSRLPMPAAECRPAEKLETVASLEPAARALRSAAARHRGPSHA